jgi:mannose-6-phosphate isomerase-like protein (cupin superfamily)
VSPTLPSPDALARERGSWFNRRRAVLDPRGLPSHEPRPGWSGRFFHSDHMTFAYYDIAAYADVHAHEHPHEEVWHVVAGALKLTHRGPSAR